MSRARRSGAGAAASGSPEAAASARIALWVARARVAGACGGFLLGLWVCRRAGLPWPDATLRGLIAGLGLCLVAWLSTLLVIQALVRTAAERKREDIEEATAQVAAARAERYAKEDEDIQRRLRRRRGEPEPDAEDAAGDETPAEALT